MHGTRAKLLVPVCGTRNLGGELGSCAMGLITIITNRPAFPWDRERAGSQVGHVSAGCSTAARMAAGWPVRRTAWRLCGCRTQPCDTCACLGTSFPASGRTEPANETPQRVRTIRNQSRSQTIDKVGQLLGRGLVSKDNQPMKCTTSKLLTCRVTNGGPI